MPRCGLSSNSCRFGAVDQTPWNDDFLVGGSRPFEVGHQDPAVRAVLQRLQELLGDDGLRVALALQRQFVHVHRVRDVDRENEFDVDGRMGFLVGELARLRTQLVVRPVLRAWCGNTRNVAAG
jgi:hypothetical protein